MLVWRSLKPSRTMIALRALIEPEQSETQSQRVSAPEPASPRPVPAARFPTPG